MKRKAILVGASGAVGNSILFQLLENKNYTSVLILVRKELRIQHPKLKQLVINFDQLQTYATAITGDVVFSCLGTTKHLSPDEHQYKKIDYRYPLEIAGIAKTNGAESFHLVSAIGANKDSTIFYTRLKGELEDHLQQIPFDNIHIYRPSLLDTPRKDKRFMEGSANFLMSIVNPLLLGPLKKYRSIKAETVANAMIRQSLSDQKGVFIHESDEMQKMTKIPL